MLEDIPPILDLHNHPEFEPYAIALGKLSHAWNHLHEALGQLFWATLGVQNGAIPLAVWYSSTSDHAQREMLRAAIAAASGQPRFAKFPSAREDVSWLLKEVDKIRGIRNDAIHAPIGIQRESEGFSVVPWSHMGNPRAKALLSKDLVKEYEWSSRKAGTLSGFAYLMSSSLWFPTTHGWPKRPKLPTLNDKGASELGQKTS